MSFLFNRGLVLAKIESVFRTDAVATPGKKAVTGLDAATAIDAVNDEVISTAHGLTAGEGPIRFTPDPGDTLPAPLEEGVDYFVNPDSAGVPANEFRVFDTRENAILDSATGLQDLVAGTPAELFSYTKTTADDMLVAEPNFNADVAVLDRTNTKTHLSVDPGAAGRKTASSRPSRCSCRAAVTSPPTSWGTVLSVPALWLAPASTPSSTASPPS
jgi:hypothetical protein